MKQRAKTNLEKMGFLDKDRNSTHDDLQLEILSNPRKVIDALFLQKQERIPEYEIFEVNLEQPVKSGNFIIGFIDVVIDFGSNEQKWTKQIAIEIKTNIESFGDTLRQINTYKNHSSIRHYCVASPDDRFKSAFLSQGVRFYTF